MSTESRELLVVVVVGHRRLEQVLEGFVELDLPGATVLDARGMAEIVTMEIPVFSGLRSLFRGGTEESYVILSVLGPAQLREALALLNDVFQGFGKEGAGIAFTLPVTRFLGREQGS